MQMAMVEKHKYEVFCHTKISFNTVKKKAIYLKHGHKFNYILIY